MRALMIAGVVAGLMAAPAAGQARAAGDSAGAGGGLEWARTLAARGEVDAARRMLARASRDARADGGYAGAALWELANLEYGRSPARAAAVLDDLAGEAALHGDPVMQARALLSSAILYQEMRRPLDSMARLERLRPVAHSPHLPEDLRGEVRRAFGSR